MVMMIYFFTKFTFDEIQTIEIEDFYKDFVAMSFDQQKSTMVSTL